MSEKKPFEETDTPPTLSVDEEETSPQVFDTPYDAKGTKKLLRKLDSHIMPVIIVLYLVSPNQDILCKQ